MLAFRTDSITNLQYEHRALRIMSGNNNSYCQVFVPASSVQRLCAFLPQVQLKL